MAETAKDCVGCPICGLSVYKADPRTIRFSPGLYQDTRRMVHICHSCTRDIKLALAEQDEE